MYGSLTKPLTFGSGGTYASGGGAIHIIASSLQLSNTTISSNGASACGAGAGGSIWIEVANNIIGNGFITANGGNTTATNCGSGGGGRVAIYASILASTISVQAIGGKINK